MRQKLYRGIQDLYVKMNVPLMIHKNFQAYYLQFHLYKMMKKMYHMVESSFTNIPVEETINYIIEQIYVHKKLMPICSKLIFRRLLIKLATECTFKFNSRFLKQVDGCTMGGPLSVTFSDIYMVKMEMML